MDRIKRATPATISNTWKNGSTVLDPGTVTIGVTAADGTVVVPPLTPTSGGGAAARTFDLTSAHTAALDTLTATWTSSDQGVDPTTHEIVGDFLCSLEDLGEVVTGKSDAQLRQIRTQLEQRLEKALGYACVPRYALESKTPSNGVLTTKLPLRTVRSLAIDGVAYSAGQITALRVSSVAVYGVSGRWPVLLGYEYGYDSPDEDIHDAMLLLAEEKYGTGAVDGRVVRQEADNMAVTYASSSSRGPFVGAELNAIIQANSLPTIG